MQYFISFLEGIITFISPCLLPMLPIYVSYFAGGKEKSTKKTVINAFGFILGFTVVFILLGVLASTFGKLLSEHKTAVNIVTGLIVIFFGLHFLGVFKLNLFKGMGFAKTGGNYAASLAGQVKAHDDGYSQVLWLDGVERKYIEEVGAMNIFFVIDGKVCTPMLNGSILPGITRDSVINLCKSWGLTVEERRISVDELIEAQKSGRMTECFGTGTAAVISPVGKLRYKDDVMTIADGGIGKISQKIYETVTGIQTGKLADPFGWSVVL